MKTKQVFSITAVALAVAMVAPTVSAEAQAYLTLRPTIESADNGTDRDTKVDDYYSRFGLRASHDYNGLTAGVHGEWNANGDLGDTRHSYGYLAGDFGKISFGQTSGVVNSVVSSMTELGWSDGASFGSTVSSRYANQVRYTFKADAFTVDAAVRRSSDETRGLDLGGQVYLGDFTIGAAFSNEKTAGKDAVAGVTTTSTGTGTYDHDSNPTTPDVVIPVTTTSTTAGTDGVAAKDVDRIALGASYSTGPVTIASTYHSEKIDGADAKPSAFEIAAAYSLTDKLTVDAIYTAFDDDQDGDQATASGVFAQGKESTYAVGASYSVAPNVLLFTAYEATQVEAGEDTSLATVGLKFDLNIMSAMGTN